MTNLNDIKAVAAKRGVPVIDVRLSEVDAKDFRGLPMSEADYIEQRAIENDYDRSVES